MGAWEVLVFEAGSRLPKFYFQQPQIRYEKRYQESLLIHVKFAICISY